MKIQPKFKWDRQWDYFTSLRTSAFYNWYSQKKNIQCFAVTVQPKRCFFTNRNIPEIPLSSNMFKPSGFFSQKLLTVTVATGMDLSTTSTKVQNARLANPAVVTPVRSQVFNASPGELLASSSKNGASLLYIQQSLLFIQQKSLNKNHPQRMPQMLNCQLAGGPIGFVDEAMLATPPFTRELHLAEMS